MIEDIRRLNALVHKNTMNGKIKILHIGPIFAPPMCDVIRQIKEHTDFSNTIISNNSTKFIMPEGFFSDDMPIYVYPYDKECTESLQMRTFVDNVLSIEKPDIIIGHCFSETSIILNCALTIRNVPAMAFIWGNGCFIKNFGHPLYKKIFFDNLTVLKKLNYILITIQPIIDICATNYGIKQSDFAFAGPPINLAQYTDHIPNTSKGPVLLLAKPRGDIFIYENLPILFDRFPNLIVHAFRFEPGITLAKKFKVHKRVIWHNLLSQKNFSELIKQCNIVFTITGDAGIGGTAIQASYAGCINLMKQLATSAGVLDNNINAIMCKANPLDVLHKLVYSIQHLPGLCRRFKTNNKHLIKYDQENTWKGFYQALLDCLEGRKGKIVPTCREAQ